MEDKVLQIIKETCALKEESIINETELKDISLDSLSFISLIVNLEQEFNIEFEDEELNLYDYKTVKDILELVKEKCKK